MKYNKIISGMKAKSFFEAMDKSLTIEASGQRIGSLVPVGNWLLADDIKIDQIVAWRSKHKNMFLSRFEPSKENTKLYLENSAIGDEDRLFFLIYDNSGRFVGHVGIKNVNRNSCELDNLIRGISGGHPNLMYFAEMTLIKWVCDSIGCKEFLVGVLSYNWLVINLHESVGFNLLKKFKLQKLEMNNIVTHKFVDNTISDSNVDYEYHVMRLLLK